LDAERVSFYMDVHVPLAVTRGMRRRGIDVLTAQDAEMERASDPEHLAFATSRERVLVTQDDDFLVLHASGVPHAGIAYAQQGTTIGQVVRGLRLIFEVMTPDEMRNWVEYL
jgi:hypothetical protein